VPWTKRPGSHVACAGALAACRDILDGRYDDVAVETFYFSGVMPEILGRGTRPEPLAQD